MTEDKTKAQKETEGASKEASDLAKKSHEETVETGNSAVNLAGAGREDAMDRVDTLADDQRQVLGAKDSEGHERGSRRQRGQYAGKSFVALHAILRNGAPIYPGDPVKFDADEDEHVGNLLQAGVIVEGAEGSKEVEAALGKADLARGRALAQSGGI